MDKNKIRNIAKFDNCMCINSSGRDLFFLQDNSANSIVLSLFKSDAKRLARTFSGSLRFSLLDDDSSGWKQHKYNVEKIK